MDNGSRGWIAHRGLRFALLLMMFGAVTLLSYRMATALRGGVAPALASAEAMAADTPIAGPFASGQHLAAFVFVASDCGFSAHPTTVDALRQLPGLLRDRAAGRFANVSVIGIALDDEVAPGIGFLQDLQQPGSEFDEISAGNSWMNEQAIRLMWRDGAAAPLLPQVLLVERSVDARMYPRHIEVRADSVILNVVGRDDILRWVGDGAPLDAGGSPR